MVNDVNYIGPDWRCERASPFLAPAQPAAAPGARTARDHRRPGRAPPHRQNPPRNRRPGAGRPGGRLHARDDRVRRPPASGGPARQAQVRARPPPRRARADGGRSPPPPLRPPPSHGVAGGAPAPAERGGARLRRGRASGAPQAARGGRVTAAFLRANRRTWASLRKHRNYRIFFSGQVVSVTGTWMQNIAAAWLVLQLTHSPVAVGVLMLCQFLPATVLGLFGGVLVDRLDVRRTVVATQAASMAFAAALAGLTLGGAVAVWQVYLLAGLRGVSLVLDHPARQALTFQLVGRRELPNAVALNSSLFNGARVVGPALGGAVIAASGPGVCFLLNAVSFLAA